MQALFEIRSWRIGKIPQREAHAMPRATVSLRIAACGVMGTAQRRVPQQLPF
jgi:hypothetical protein